MVYNVIICIFILPNKMIFSNQILGSSLSLPAYGREGQEQHLFSWRRISQSEIRKIAAAKKEAAKARAGKNSFPPTPFLFARPSGKVFIKIRNLDFRQKKFGF